MKLIFTFLICFIVTLTCFSQQKAKYSIRVVERNGSVIRGSFYAASDDGLTLIKNRRDTIKLKAENITALHIHRKGIVAPIAIACGLTFFVLAVKSDKIAESLVLIFVGIPAGTSGGLLIGQSIANKKHYKKLEAKDFPLIKSSLQKYTVLK